MEVCKNLPSPEKWFTISHSIITTPSSPISNGDCITQTGSAATTVTLSELIHTTLQIENTVCATTSSWSLYGSLSGFSLGKEQLLGVDLYWISLFASTSSGNWQGYIYASSTTLFSGGITNFTLSLDSNSTYLVTRVIGIVQYSTANGMISLENVSIEFDSQALLSNNGISACIFYYSLNLPILQEVLWLPEVAHSFCVN